MKQKYLFFTAAFLFVLITSLPLVSAYSLMYDANGNLITGDGKYREYNGFNKLVRVRDGNNATGNLLEEYMWEADKDKVLVKHVYENNTWKESVYYPSQTFLMVKNASGTFKYKYIYQNGQLVAFENYDGKKFFVLGDHKGSASVITNESGAKVEETFYEPFGKVISGAATSRFNYEGKEYDSIVGMTDFGARQKLDNPPVFTQPDTIIQNIYDPQSLNRYAFERNNPYAYTDPNGKAAIWIHYFETRDNYIAAGFSENEAKTIAYGAIEPDLYRYRDSKFMQQIAKWKGLDLKMEHEEDAEPYYHNYINGDRNLENDYWNAVQSRDLAKIGNIEHALGHDVGSIGVPGFHQTADIQNQFKLFGMRVVHFAHDIVGWNTDRQQLNGQQSERAKAAATLMGGSNKGEKVISYELTIIKFNGGFKWTKRVVTSRR